MAGLKTDAEFIDPADDIQDIEGIKEYLRDLVHRGNKLKRDYEKVDLEATITRVVRNSGGGSGAGGGTVAVIPFRTSAAVVAGPNTIPIPADMRTGTVDYIVNAVLFISGFGAQIMGQPETKNTNSFAYSDIPAAGTLYFDIGQQP